ncbi:uncharacterized protein LOC119191263 [Manduca sexta]|uniref:uncharacterized protein LOC119191263 n=1 Tax=Manduca sexta TaxID=7130 RepID=UPI00188E1EBE|nr:uncharacterized protein LOC119191263 [Manduca sexta]
MKDLTLCFKTHKNCNSDHTKWIIVSDSRSVLENLANNQFHANTNYVIYLIKELWVELSKLDIVVRFVWVPSHIGVIGNERADYLAKKLLKYVSSMGRHSYQYTHHENKGNWFASMDVQINSTPWFCKKNNFINRKFYSIICRMRFGHYRLNCHLHRIKMAISPYCEYCQSQKIQSLHHIFFECSSFNIQRLVLADELLKIYKKPNRVPQCLKELLKNASTYVYLYKFIKDTVNDI